MIHSLRVLIVGKRLPLPTAYAVEHLDGTARLWERIANFKPDVILSSGSYPGPLVGSSFEIRRQWLHVDPNADEAALVRACEGCYANNLWAAPSTVHPLVSVYTASCDAGDYLRDTYQSLRDQTWTTWEWIVVDDASADGTWDRLQTFAREDPRVRPVQLAARSGRIGEVKDQATRLCRGVYLVELDHDDRFTDTALDEIRVAFDTHPDAGMVYANCAAHFEDGSAHRYNDQFWASRYREVEYRGKTYLECRNPDVYDRFGPGHDQQFAWFLTVGPNHPRAYRAETLRALGGYNPGLPVADDWDVYARFFLRSRCLHLDRLLYLYRFRDGYANATFSRNTAIQEHLALGRARYEQEFRAVNEKRFAAQPLAQPALVALGFQAGVQAQAQPSVQQPKLSVVIPYGADSGAKRALLLRCLRSVREHEPSTEVVLVANGCSVSEEAVALTNKLVKSEVNLRFAAAVNAGDDLATGEYLCVLNDDAELVEATLTHLVAASTPEHPITAPYCDRAKTPQGDVAREATPAQDLHPEMVTGVCMVLPTALFRDLGGFDPRLYTYEDDDLCTRARARGLGCTVVGGTWVHHERHATFQALGEDVHAIMRDNGMRYTRMHPKVAVVALAKDEAGAVEEFLDQWPRTWARGVLIDAGTTDDTQWRAGKRGRIAVEPFEDFASARNLAEERFAEDAAWVIALDPDERLDPVTLAALPEVLASTDADVLMAPLVAVAADGTRTQWVSKPVAYRRGAVRWAFPVHEKLVPVVYRRGAVRWAFPVHEKLVPVERLDPGTPKFVLLTNAVIEHRLALHDLARRASAEALYARLEATERPGVRERAREIAPVLDYNHSDDPRIEKRLAGPLVTVVIPTYRRSALLERAVRSALAQDWLALEVVVVGDACPDLNVAAVARLGPGRVRVLNLPRNYGAGGAEPRNYGVRLAAGSWVAYLDDDNEWAPDHVSSLMVAALAKSATWAFSSMSADGRDLGFVGPPDFQRIDTSCVVHRRDLLRRHGPWKSRDQVGYAHDWELFSRWLTAGEPWVATGRPTVKYNAETCGQRDFVISGSATS